MTPGVVYNNSECSSTTMHRLFLHAGSSTLEVLIFYQECKETAEGGALFLSSGLNLGMVQFSTTSASSALMA